VNVRLSRTFLTAVVFFTACKSTPDNPKPEKPDKPASLSFEPATFQSPIHHKEGEYPDLISPESFAVLVAPEVADVKRAEEEESGVTVDPFLSKAASYVTEHYFVFECHLVSMFRDTSIAYDTVGLRGIEAYIEAADGQRIAPIQRILGPSAGEEQVEALRKFSRTNILVFPKADSVLGRPTLAPGQTELRLILEGASSSFYFAWPAAPAAAGSGDDSKLPTAKEAAKMIKTGFSEIFSRLRVLAENFN
jgi:hypothetical protein